MSTYSSNYCDFHRFLLLRNKARNAGRSGKSAGIKPKCGISRTIAGRLTPMNLKHYLSTFICITDVTKIDHCYKRISSKEIIVCLMLQGVAAQVKSAVLLATPREPQTANLVNWQVGQPIGHMTKLLIT